MSELPGQVPLKVWIVCTGVGVMNRGVESAFRECFDALHPTAKDHGVHLSLYKGAGAEAVDEHRVWCLPRTGSVSAMLGKVIRRNSYVVEQLSSVLPVARLIRRHRPDLIYYGDCNLAMRLWKFRERIGVPYRLLYINGAPLRPPYGNAEHIQHVAPYYLDEAIAAGEDPDRHTLVPYGFHVPTGADDLQAEARAAARRALGLPADRRIVLSVGWVAAQHKRMDYLVNELAALPEPRPLLLMLGAIDAENSPPIVALAREKLGEGNVIIKSVPYEQTPRYYQAADVFVLCSLKEGFGRVYIEALSHGLRAVAHDHPVMRFALGEDGRFGDLSRAGTLTAILSELLGQPDYVEARIRRRESARRRFGWEALTPRYFDLFKKVAGQSLIVDRFGLKKRDQSPAPVSSE